MNPGMLKHRIAFLQKSETVRDELGGKMPAMYSEVFKLWAAKSERPASRRELMGEHVIMCLCFLQFAGAAARKCLM